MTDRSDSFGRIGRVSGIGSRSAPQHATAQARVRYAAQEGLLRDRWSRIVIPVLLVLTVLAGLVGGPKLLIGPAVVGVVLWGAFVLPLETVVPATIFLLCSVNSPSGTPGNRKVDWILNPIGDFFFTNLPIKASIADFMIAGLVFRAAAVLLLSERNEGLDRRPPRPFAQACLLALLAVCGAEFVGIFLRNGNFQQSLWQLRIPLLLPAFALAVSAAATDLGIRRIRVALLGAGLMKAFEAFCVTFVFGYAAEGSGAYVTTHSDSMIWVTCIAILVATWFETRAKFDRQLMLALVPIYLLSIQLNNRRVAYVALAASIWLIIAVAHGPVKRQLRRYLSYSWPLLVVYIVVGFGAQPANPLFAPITKIASVSTNDDTSTDTRDIENTNLLFTIRNFPIVGTGFGHEYNEVIKAYDIQKDFEQYRYLPHNSFLAFWAFNSVIWSSMYFLLPVVAVFYAIGSRRQSMVPHRRAAGAWATCVTIAFLVQAWADLGMQDWMAMVCVGSAFGVAGSLGRSTIQERIPARATRRHEYVEDDLGGTPELRQTSELQMADA